jgi:hypothetical protein
LDQVENGVAVRMAVLYLLAGATAWFYKPSRFLIQRIKTGKVYSQVFYLTSC